MLCDRCVLNGRCECFVPAGECSVERQAYEKFVSELMSQYGLEGFADEVLAGRVAMYLVRIARAEVYEANVGVSAASAVWGKYIADLDKTLRSILRDLAVTRRERNKQGKDDVLVGVDQLLHVLADKSVQKPKRSSALAVVLRRWSVDMPKLRKAAEKS